MLSCDNCKKDFEEYHNGFSIFVDENSAHEHAANDNWYLDGDKHYCPDCYTLDDDDKLILKPIDNEH
jgi:hypothetical protein